MNMALNDTVAVLKRERRLDRGFVSLDPIGKADEFWNLTPPDLF
jgi:hypothetical protein